MSSNSLALYKFLTQYNASDPVQNKNVSGRSGIVVTMSDYYNETVEEQKIWNKTYMNLHPTRKLITGCANEDVAKWKGETTRTTIEPVQQQELLYNNNNNNKDDDMKNDDENKNNYGVVSEKTICAVISDSTCAGLDWIRTQWQRIHVRSWHRIRRMVQLRNCRCGNRGWYSKRNKQGNNNCWYSKRNRKKKKQESRPAEHKKQLESRSMETTGK